MALVKANLESALKALMDPNDVGFTTFPASTPITAERWSTIINNYASSVIPASLGSAAAKLALQTTLLGIDPNTQNGLVLFANGLTAYAAALGAGMAPAFIAVPPPIPIVLSTMSAAGLAGASGSDCASILATLIDTWFRTGTATPSGGGSPIFWS